MGGRTKKKPEVRWSQARHRPSRGGFELAYALEHPLMSDGVGGYFSCIGIVGRVRTPSACVWCYYVIVCGVVSSGRRC